MKLRPKKPSQVSVVIQLCSARTGIETCILLSTLPAQLGMCDHTQAQMSRCSGLRGSKVLWAPLAALFPAGHLGHSLSMSFPTCRGSKANLSTGETFSPHRNIMPVTAFLNFDMEINPLGFHSSSLPISW